jgi:hypothetical protein
MKGQLYMEYRYQLDLDMHKNIKTQLWGIAGLILNCIFHEIHFLAQSFFFIFLGPKNGFNDFTKKCI